ncbi:DUF4197 domain-containing protein [Ramlibacter sp. XY19]|uniref:DUF4197 domain-containing protein n=1 Tax=Ramlibacter paludis TaxID=2908000 RepID=UPI0023DC9FE3|nr:DUF4197 domain-containing protein [Ramlibacter paludis]MCG2594826.1 DUF4197 domain-containing protein [Ramlibacter paludis]
MDRRHFSCGLAGLLLAARAQAQGLAGISDLDASKGLKGALETGALAAVKLLGRPDGFLGNPQVRIPLPGYLKDAAKLLSAIGQKRQVQELETAMNRAAENAVPMAKDLLVKAVKTMSVTDAKQILSGGDTSVTDFFAGKTRAPLSTQFLPVVKQQTSKVDLAAKYDAIAGKAAGMGLVKQEDASVDHYVTRKALDGLYFMIGEEEKKIRRDPVGTGSALLGKVFGALK